MEEVYQLAGNEQVDSARRLEKRTSELLLSREKLISYGSRVAFGAAPHYPFVEE